MLESQIALFADSAEGIALVAGSVLTLLLMLVLIWSVMTDDEYMDDEFSDFCGGAMFVTFVVFVIALATVILKRLAL